MALKTCIAICILLFSLPVLAGDGGTNGKNVAIQKVDIKAVIYEHTIEDFLAAMMPINGEGKIFGVIPFAWTVSEPRVNISTEMARATANVAVTVAGYTYQTQAYGTIGVRYDQQQNYIYISAESLYFDVELSLFGQDIDIYRFDIANYFKPQFHISGPRPLYPFFTFKLPTGKMIQFFVKASDYTIWYEPEQVVIGIDYIFQEEPPEGFVPPTPDVVCPPPVMQATPNKQ